MFTESYRLRSWRPQISAKPPRMHSRSLPACGGGSGRGLPHTHAHPPSPRGYGGQGAAPPPGELRSRPSPASGGGDAKAASPPAIRPHSPRIIVAEHAAFLVIREGLAVAREGDHGAQGLL